MADYHSVLQRAIANLPQSTGQARREIYDKARKALVRQLESFDPPLPPAEITAQRLALEEAIRRIETEVVRRTTAAPAPRPPVAAERAPAPAPRAPAPRPAAPPAPPVVTAPPAPERPAPQPPVEALAPPALPEPPPAPVAAEPVFQPAMPEPPPAPVFQPEPAPPAPPAAIDTPRLRPAADVRHAPVAPPVSAPHAPEGGWTYSEDGQTLPPARDFDPRLPEDEEEEALYRAELAASREPPARVAPKTARAQRPVRPPADDEYRPRARPERDGGAGTKHRAGRVIALGLVVVALLGGTVGAVYYMTTGRQPAEPVQTSGDTRPAPEPAAETPPADSAAADSQDGKLPDRLGEDVKRVPTRRITTTAPDETPAEDPAATDAAAAGSTVPPPPAPEAPPEPAATMSATGDRSILYEEGAAQGSRGSAAVGKVKWSLVQESFGGGPKEPMVRAVVTIPERKVNVELLFRQNHDQALPASHLVEITYALPDNFPGGGISNVPGLIMKASEESRGDALLGASARVSDGLFWIALAQSATDVARNDGLLKDRNWIDIPMLYNSGRRAILTVEKGPEGDKALDTALDAWNKKGG